MKLRYIPPNIWEDAKLFKKVPISSIYYAVAAMVLGVAAFILKFRTNPILGVIFILLIPSLVIAIFTAEIPTRISKNIGIKVSQKMFKTLYDICRIKEFGTVCKTKRRKVIFMENKVYPWDYCVTKDEKADLFAQEVFNIVKGSTVLSIYGTCAPEDTKQLLKRYDELHKLPPKLREIENARVEEHFRISSIATATKYVTRVSKPIDADDEEILNIQRNISNSEIIGGDIIEDIVSSHLTIGSSVERGKVTPSDANPAPNSEDDSILMKLANMILKIKDIKGFKEDKNSEALDTSELSEESKVNRGRGRRH